MSSVHPLKPRELPELVLLDNRNLLHGQVTDSGDKSKALGNRASRRLPKARSAYFAHMEEFVETQAYVEDRPLSKCRPGIRTAQHPAQ